MRTLIIALLLLNTICSVGLCSFSDFFANSNLNTKWTNASREYSKVAFHNDYDRLHKTKKLLKKICSNNTECLQVYSHYFSYLYFKSILKRKYNKTYLAKIDEFSLMQVKMVEKCNGELNCEEQTIRSLCNISDKTSMFVKPFCISNFLVFNVLTKKSGGRFE